MGETDVGIISTRRVGPGLIASWTPNIIGRTLVLVWREIVVRRSVTASILLRSLSLLSGKMLLGRRRENRLREGGGCGRVLSVGRGEPFVIIPEVKVKAVVGIHCGRNSSGTCLEMFVDRMFGSCRGSRRTS